MLPIYADTALADSLEAWRMYSQTVGSPAPELRRLIPDFLIIGAPKAGTSWLFSALSCHPGVFIPVEKELQYFNNNWRHYPIDTYLRRFEAGAGLAKGDATTSYCRLPSTAIETIRRLNPQIKLLFLVRDPVEQAWSQMKHMFRYHNANFWRYQCLFENLTIKNYVENFIDDLALSCTDYRNIIERWRRFFPRENFWIASLEEIANNPQRVYRSAVEFLGLAASQHAERVPLDAKINEGLSYNLDETTERILRTLHRPRAVGFLDYVKREFDRDFSSLWTRTFGGDVSNEPWILAENFHGWRVVLCNGKLWGYPAAAQEKVAVINGKIVSSVGTVPVHAADFNYELQRKLGTVRGGSSTSEEDDRLERATSALPQATITFVVEEIEELGDYFCARMITRSDSSAGGNHDPKSAPQFSATYAEIADSPPVYVGMRKDMWPVQPWMAPLLTRKGLSPVVFVAADRESIRRQLAPFVHTSSEPIIEESYRGFNIIRLRHDLIAIKQSLGAVDLSFPLEQLALQFGEEDFMTDTDIGALRVRIAEVETRRNTRAGLTELHAHLDRINSRHDSALAQLQAQLDTLQQTLATSMTKRHGRLVATVRHLLSTNKSPHGKKNSLSEARRRDQGIASATKKSI